MPCKKKEVWTIEFLREEKIVLIDLHPHYERFQRSNCCCEISDNSVIRRIMCLSNHILRRLGFIWPTKRGLRRQDFLINNIIISAWVHWRKYFVCHRDCTEKIVSLLLFNCVLTLSGLFQAVIWFISKWLFVWVLWRINLCRLFNAESIFIWINTSISNGSV